MVWLGDKIWAIYVSKKRDFFLRTIGTGFCTVRTCIKTKVGSTAPTSFKVHHRINRKSSYKHCIGSIDCTKIRIPRPDSHGSLQSTIFSSQKRMNCLLYQTICIPDGYTSAMYGPVEKGHRDLTILRQDKWEETFLKCLLIDKNQLYIYGDST